MADRKISQLPEQVATDESLQIQVYDQGQSDPAERNRRQRIDRALGERMKRSDIVAGSGITLTPGSGRQVTVAAAGGASESTEEQARALTDADSRMSPRRVLDALEHELGHDNADLFLDFTSGAGALAWSSATDNRGSFWITTDASGPPTAANAYTGWNGATAGSRVLVVGNAGWNRTGSSFTPSFADADALPSGTITMDGGGNGVLTFTPGAADWASIGTGNARVWWRRGTLAVTAATSGTGVLARLRSRTVGALDVALPPGAIYRPPWQTRISDLSNTALAALKTLLGVSAGGGTAAAESTEAQAEAGTDSAAANATRMSPRRVWAAIKAVLAPTDDDGYFDMAGIGWDTSMDMRSLMYFATTSSGAPQTSDVVSAWSSLTAGSAVILLSPTAYARGGESYLPARSGGPTGDVLHITAVGYKDIGRITFTPDASGWTRIGTGNGALDWARGTITLGTPAPGSTNALVHITDTAPPDVDIAIAARSIVRPPWLSTLTDVLLLNLAKAVRTSADRGKSLTVGKADENVLDLADPLDELEGSDSDKYFFHSTVGPGSAFLTKGGVGILTRTSGTPQSGDSGPVWNALVSGTTYTVVVSKFSNDAFGSGDTALAVTKADVEAMTTFANWQEGGASNQVEIGTKTAVQSLGTGDTAVWWFRAPLSFGGTLHGEPSGVASLAAHVASPTNRQLRIPFRDIAGVPRIPDTPDAPAAAAADKKYELQVASGGARSWVEAAEGGGGSATLAATTETVRVPVKGTALVLDRPGNGSNARTKTQAHGLGGEPDWADLVAECKAADRGYAVGDILDITGHGDGIVVRWDGTNVYLSINQNGIWLNNKTNTQGAQRMDETRWEFTVTPWRTENKALATGITGSGSVSPEPYPYFQQFKPIATPSTVASTIPSTGDGYDFPLIAKTNSSGPLIQGRSFKTRFEGIVNFHNAAGVNLDVEYELRFTHHFSEITAGPSSDLVSTRVYKAIVTSDGEFSIPLTVFNSDTVLNQASNFVVPISAVVRVRAFTLGTATRTQASFNSLVYNSVGATFYQDSGGLAPSGGGSALTVKDEGAALATAATALDFVGAGVQVTGAGAEKTITIAGGGSGGGGLSGRTVNADIGGAWEDILTGFASGTTAIVSISGTISSVAYERTVVLDRDSMSNEIAENVQMLGDSTDNVVQVRRSGDKLQAKRFDTATVTAANSVAWLLGAASGGAGGATGPDYLWEAGGTWASRDTTLGNKDLASGKSFANYEWLVAYIDNGSSEQASPVVVRRRAFAAVGGDGIVAWSDNSWISIKYVSNTRFALGGGGSMGIRKVEGVA